MKIAISSTGKDLNSSVAEVFGRADYFVIVDVELKSIVNVIDNSISQNSSKGAGISASALVAKAGAKKVLSGMIGPKAVKVLTKAGIEPVDRINGTIEEVINTL